jgi:glutamyl-tRNA reductase
MTVLALGLNHGSAPIDLRGRFAFPLEALGRSVQGLREHLSQAQPEVAILSTCNRTELYVGLPATACPRHAMALAEPAIEWLAAHGGTQPAELRTHSYFREGAEAARHAFRVAAGLDSMVLGEPQILGQMKAAVREAHSAGALGTTLHQMFQRSFAVAKEVRSRTEIGAHAVSLAAAAVRLAQQLFDDLAQRRVLFVGAGEMIDLVATHFAAQKPLQMTVANRSAERGRELAERLGAAQLPLSELGQALSGFDIVISCTASSLPLIGLGAVERALKARKRRPMLMIDLAVPRDIEPEVAALDDVYLYTVDDLAQQVQANGERRQAAVVHAEAIVNAGVDSFAQWLEQRASVPLIQALHKQTEDWRQLELSKARRALAKGQDVEAVMESLSAALTRKLLHGALSELHGSAGETHRQWVSSVQRLFLRDNL